MTNYPEADRYIPATPALLDGWFGPCDYLSPLPTAVWATTTGKQTFDASVWARKGVRLDPLRPEVRDHLIRRLSLPDWMRDGAGLEPWQSAGLIACAAAGAVPATLFRVWEDRWRDAVFRGEARTERWFVYASGLGWGLVDNATGRDSDMRLPATMHGSETGDAGKRAADTAALAHGCALLLDADTMVLPWPGGPKLWRKP